jgi:hypothetical protein
MHAGEPPSLLTQNFWQTLSRSEQVFASAGPISESATTPNAPAAMLERNRLRTRPPQFSDNTAARKVRREIGHWQRAGQTGRSLLALSALPHRPGVHRAAAVRRLRDTDKQLVVFAAAESQELACARIPQLVA